ncbi:MAG: dihydrodipicolinate synthase family protein [Armatimonadota bacterium]|nr:dihydrodipicolinate synthase family protein [Armatimonadota bacterium]
MAELKGIVAAILTPFDERDNVDLDYMKRHLRFVEAGGAQGFVPSGSNGEAASMRLEERKRIIELCGANKGSMFMVAGTGSTSLSETLELSRCAESAGADAIMVLPPFFFTYAPVKGIIDYYRRVFDAVSLPIFLYNIPQCTGIRISEEIIHGLREYPHLVGVKDSSGQIDSVLNYIENFPGLKIFVGNDHQVLSVLEAGGEGHITGMPNAFPELTTELYKAFVAGEDASEQQARLSKARDIIAGFPEFAVNKYVLSLRGFPLRYCRLPLLDMTDEEKTRFVGLMKENGLWSL